MRSVCTCCKCSVRPHIVAPELHILLTVAVGVTRWCRIVSAVLCLQTDLSVLACDMEADLLTLPVNVQSDDKASSHKEKPFGTASAPEGPSNPASATPSAPPSTTGTATPRTTGLTRPGSGRAGGTPKAKDTPKTASKGAAKGSKKTVPASFVEVIDCLVDVTLRYKGMQPGEEADLADPVSEAMETDEPFTISAQLPDGRMVRVSATQPGRGAGAAAGQQPGASQTAGQGGQSKASAKASFTEQVSPATASLQRGYFASNMSRWPFKVPSITLQGSSSLVDTGMPGGQCHCLCQKVACRSVCCSAS